jgi:hypothetical protein
MTNMKNTIRFAIAATSFLAVARTINAQTTILTDNFAADANMGPNYELATRQTGAYATSGYTTSANGNVQVGNTTTDAGQPGAPGGNYFLVAEDSGVQNNLALNDTVDGGNALTFTFSLYDGVNIPDPTDWMAFSLSPMVSSVFPTAASFSFLARENGGVQVFDNGNAIVSENSGFVSSTLWSVTFSGAGGVGSPFDGATDVSILNGSTTVDQFTLSSGLAPGEGFGFYAAASMIGGVGNLDVVAAPEPSSIALAGLGMAGLLVFRRRQSAPRA